MFSMHTHCAPDAQHCECSRLGLEPGFASSEFPLIGWSMMWCGIDKILTDTHKRPLNTKAHRRSCGL